MQSRSGSSKSRIRLVLDSENYVIKNLDGNIAIDVSDENGLHLEDVSIICDGTGGGYIYLPVNDYIIEAKGPHDFSVINLEGHAVWVRNAEGAQTYTYMANENSITIENVNIPQTSIVLGSFDDTYFNKFELTAAYPENSSPILSMIDDQIHIDNVNEDVLFTITYSTDQTNETEYTENGTASEIERVAWRSRAEQRATGQELEPIHFDESVTLVLPDGLISIEKNAFTGASFKKIVCNAQLQVINDYAFEDCDQVKIIELVSPDTEIREHAFDGCDKGMIVKAPNPSKARTFALENGFKYEEY